MCDFPDWFGIMSQIFFCDVYSILGSRNELMMNHGCPKLCLKQHSSFHTTPPILGYLKLCGIRHNSVAFHFATIFHSLRKSCVIRHNFIVLHIATIWHLPINWHNSATPFLALEKSINASISPKFLLASANAICPNLNIDPCPICPFQLFLRSLFPQLSFPSLNPNNLFTFQPSPFLEAKVTQSTPQ